MERVESKGDKQEVFRAVENYVNGICTVLVEIQAKFEKELKDMRLDAALNIKVNVQAALRPLVDQLPERLKVDMENDYMDITGDWYEDSIEYNIGKNKFEVYNRGEWEGRGKFSDLTSNIIPDERWIELGPKLLEAAKEAMGTKSATL